MRAPRRYALLKPLSKTFKRRLSGRTKGEIATDGRTNSNSHDAVCLPPELCSAQACSPAASARIDSCTELGVFWRVMLPLVRPAALGAAALQLCQFVERLRAALDRTSDGCAPHATKATEVVVAHELTRRASA
jgi:hypothetical protein